VKLIKNIIPYVFLFSLLLSSTGISVYKHYCGDFLASFSFYTPADDCSPDGDESCEEKGKDCCDDETEYFTADIDLVKQEVQDFHFVPNFFLVSNVSETEEEIEELSWICAELKEPPINGPPRYIKNSQLTYYG